MATVLVVEDDSAIAELVQGILEDEGHTAVLAEDGQQALARLRERRFDLIVADLMMPNLDGRGLRQAIADTPAYRAIPVILMTAASYVTEDDRRAFDAVLQKPFHLDQVLQVASQLLSSGPPRP